jgi:hypothetical protein
MKIPRYSANKNSLAIKGNLTAEEIVRSDWERNYKNTEVTLDDLKFVIKDHVDEGLPIYRFRNTLVLVTPENGFEEIEFHTLTADPFEIYTSLMMMFFISLAKNEGTQLAYTYVDDKKVFRAIKRMVGEFGSLEDNEEDPELGKYIFVFEVGAFVAAMEQKIPQGGQ